MDRVNVTGREEVQNYINSIAAAVKITQNDVDEAFINYAGTNTVDSTRSISSSTATAGTKTGAIKIEVNGVTHWIRTWSSAV